MKKPNITPGEWRAKDQTNRPDSSCEKGWMICPRLGNKHIGKVFIGTDLTHSPETQKANARAIAAVPDLLAALERIVTEYDQSPDGPLGKGFTNGTFFQAKQALTKAGYTFP